MNSTMNDGQRSSWKIRATSAVLRGKWANTPPAPSAGAVMLVERRGWAGRQASNWAVPASTGDCWHHDRSPKAASRPGSVSCGVGGLDGIERTGAATEIQYGVSSLEMEPQHSVSQLTHGVLRVINHHDGVLYSVLCTPYSVT